MGNKSINDWYSTKNPRACFWFACRLTHEYSIEKTQIENIDDAFEFIKTTLLEKNVISTYKYMNNFKYHEELFDFSWTKDMTINQNYWFLEYTEKSILNNNSKIKPPLLDFFTDSKKAVTKGVYIFDSIDKDIDTLSNIYRKIRSAYNQKKKRDKNTQEKRKQCNISLSENHFNMLNDIVNTSGLTKQEAIESLILNYHENNIGNITTKTLPAPKSLTFKK